MLEKEAVAKESKNVLLEAMPQNLFKEEVERKIKIKIDRDIDKLGLNHQRKLIHLSEQQGKPLWETNKKAYTLVCLVDTHQDFVLNAISKRPRSN